MRSSLWMRRAQVWMSLITKEMPRPKFWIIQGGKHQTQPPCLCPRASEIPKSVDGSSSEKWKELFQIGKLFVETTNSLNHLRGSLANPCLVWEVLKGIFGVLNAKKPFLAKG